VILLCIAVAAMRHHRLQASLIPCLGAEVSSGCLPYRRIAPLPSTQNCSREMRLPLRNSPTFVICWLMLEVSLLRR
jgi:hypothetical protein